MKKKILIFLFFYLALAFSPAFPEEDVFKIKLEVKTEKELLFLKEIGLDCPDKGECICQANISQLNQLRTAHYPYTPLKQGIRIEKEKAQVGIKAPVSLKSSHKICLQNSGRLLNCCKAIIQI
jgi:hypothetical protein